VTARIPVREGRDDRYFTDTYQLIPKYGYTTLFNNLMNHPNITVLLRTPWEYARDVVKFKRLIFTGPIDSYFSHIYGELPYRSLFFEYEWHPVAKIQPVATINYPDSRKYTRSTEFTQITGQKKDSTVIVKEYPTAVGEPYYPVPSSTTKELFKKYEMTAQKIDNVCFAGRLGNYKYYNMDQVVALALTKFPYLINKGW
jgi:UDP-galactopyranose mutase